MVLENASVFRVIDLITTYFGFCRQYDKNMIRRAGIRFQPDEQIETSESS